METYSCCMMASSFPAAPLLPKLPFWAAVLCFGAATGLAGLLAWQALFGHGMIPGCGGTLECGVVTASRWAYLGPIPVALPATALYATALGGLLALAPGALPGTSSASKRCGRG